MIFYYLVALMSASSSRILSRKLVFLYYYARLFNEDIIAHPIENDVVKITEKPSHEDLAELSWWLDMSDEELSVEDNTPAQPIKAMDDSTIQDDIEFIAQHQLPQHTNSQHTDYDHDFVMQLATGYMIYRDLIVGLIAPYTDKFSYDEMSLTRRAILLMGYTEYKVISTPASIIINECVELAKSYEDITTGKLINGIMHQLLEIKDTEPAWIIKEPKKKIKK